MSFTDIIKLRRSRYELTDRLPISEEKLTEIIGQCILHTPSAFNSQPARVVLLLGEKHKQLWKLTEECLREIVPADKFAPTEKKLASFSAALSLPWMRPTRRSGKTVRRRVSAQASTDLTLSPSCSSTAGQTT